MRLNELLRYDDIVIQCHDNPDADALASGYAVYWYLSAHGKTPKFIYRGSRKITKSNLMIMISELNIPVSYAPDYNEEPELLVAVDCQPGQKNVTPVRAKNTIVIDHHQVSGEVPEMSEIRSNYGSCSTVICEMLKKEGIDYNDDENIATALYYGLMTDTNGFAEVSHPSDRDLRDFAKYNTTDIILFKNSCQHIK